MCVYIYKYRRGIQPSDQQVFEPSASRSWMLDQACIVSVARRSHCTPSAGSSMSTEPWPVSLLLFSGAPGGPFSSEAAAAPLNRRENENLTGASKSMNMS